MPIYRAHAYQLHRIEPLPKRNDGDLVVFFEAAGRENAATRLPYLLSLAWQCGPDQVDSYNLMDEFELMRNSLCGPDAGDARLIEIGWHHGPLYPRRCRTLAIGSTAMLERLEQAWSTAVPLRSMQQLAAATDGPLPDAMRWQAHPADQIMRSAGGLMRRPTAGR